MLPTLCDCVRTEICLKHTRSTTIAIADWLNTMNDGLFTATQTSYHGANQRSSSYSGQKHNSIDNSDSGSLGSWHFASLTTPLSRVVPFRFLSQAQYFWQHRGFDWNRVDARAVLPSKVGKSMSRRHLKTKVEAQFLEYCCRIVPADAMRNVIYQIARNDLLGAQGWRVHISDVSHSRRCQLHGGHSLSQQIRNRLE